LPFLSTQFEQRDGAQETQLARLQAGALCPPMQTKFGKEQRNPDLEKERKSTHLLYFFPDPHGQAAFLLSCPVFAKFTEAAALHRPPIIASTCKDRSKYDSLGGHET
jgi:hypothetical protein